MSNDITIMKTAILIPCYKEISVISKTLEHFKSIIGGIENIDVYIITTEKEKYENQEQVASQR